MSASILVIDDTASNRTAYEALLSRRGDRVVVAASGEEGVLAACRQDFSVILVDVKMPGMDGYDTVKLLRTFTDLRRTSIILMSAHDTPSWTAARLKQKGVTDFFTAPIAPDRKS